MKPEIPHPCLNCSLPDCDEKSKLCALRRAINAYDRKRKQKAPISREMKAAYSLALRELYGHQKLERDARYRSSLDFGSV